MEAASKSRTTKIHMQAEVPNRLPWPRCAKDSPTTPLGVNVVEKRQDIIKIVHKYFKVQDISMDELLQEVYLAVIHKNYTNSAHDPRKSSFGHYIYMIANNVCINLVHKKKRYDRESECLDAPNGHDDGRTLLETIDVADTEDNDNFYDQMAEVEQIMRQRGMWELARYVHAARTGASSDVIREALSWGDKKISNKNMRDIRSQVRSVFMSLSTER